MWQTQQKLTKPNQIILQLSKQIQLPTQQKLPQSLQSLQKSPFRLETKRMTIAACAL